MNAFISRFRLQLLYLLMWLVVAIVHFILLYLGYELGFWPSLADSAVSNLLFALLGVGLWFSVKFVHLQKKSSSQFFIQHLTTCAAVLFIWILTINILLSALFRENEQYLDFLRNSMTMRVFSGILYYGLLVSIYYLVAGFKELQEKTRKEAQLTTMLREAELDMLRSQIKPHFLFNSLNAINSLTMSSPEKAQEMVIKLSEFMRYSLSLQGEMMSTLEKELYHIRLYLDIEQVRFAGKMKVSIESEPDALQWKVPSMILQPLVENAIKYGVYGSEGDSVIFVKALIKGHYLEISILNNYEAENTVSKGTGTGIKNVGKRMEFIYNQPGLMQLTNSGSEFEVILKIPENARN